MFVGAIVAVLAFASYKTTFWGGSCGYHQLEYELTFKDSSGNLIEGVQLKVEDQRGNPFFCFPVTDCSPDQIPKSDQHGVMRFHHVNNAVEWDNYGWLLFWVIPIQTTKSPVYICRFLHDGREVHRVPYGALPHWDWPDRGWQEVPKVKRRWNWSVMMPADFVFRENDNYETYQSRLALFFHQGGDEKPSRESIIAFRNANRLPYSLDRGFSPTKESFEDIEFPVIRRTITVKLQHDDK
jgi:hypothetical protein